MNCRLMVVALMLASIAMMGATACDPDQVEVGDEQVEITKAFADYDLNGNAQFGVFRVEFVAQLQQRVIEAQAEEIHYLSENLEWFFQCVHDTQTGIWREDCWENGGEMPY